MLAAWDWTPSIWIGCVVLVILFSFGIHFHFVARSYFFFSGIFFLLIALVSPLDALSDTYLFSAHMLQHLLLLLVIPPLFILGMPEQLARDILKRPVFGRIEQFLRKPILTWLLGIGAIWLWHLPALYNATLSNENIHILEHLCFLVTGSIFWWPVVSPLHDHRLPPGILAAYLLGAGAANDILGMLLTNANPAIYPAYLHPVDSLGILQLIRVSWRLTPSVDQQLGGLIMWFPGGLIYILALLFIPLKKGRRRSPPRLPSSD
ncbi:MAG TPA: cytochrome c oxidase assembly protein [Anaerolineaceae bacterium]|nr:cytochrome c oxidase assembly protein [Anaerolineaceae bacterium]